MGRLILAPESVCGGSLQVPEGPFLRGYWLLDTDTMLMKISHGFCDILGKGRMARLSFREFLAMVHPDDGVALRSLACTGPAAIPPALCDLVRIIRPDGRLMWIVLDGKSSSQPTEPSLVCSERRKSRKDLGRAGVRSGLPGGHLRRARTFPDLFRAFTRSLVRRQSQDHRRSGLSGS